MQAWALGHQRCARAACDAGVLAAAVRIVLVRLLRDDACRQGLDRGVEVTVVVVVVVAWGSAIALRIAGASSTT